MDDPRNLGAQAAQTMRCSDGFLQTAFPDSGVYSDCAQFDRPEPAFAELAKTPDHLILRRLSHIQVNPNDQYRTATICRSYVFSDSPDTRNTYHQTIANRTEASAERFLLQLISAAKRELDASLNTQEISADSRDVDHVYLLVGQKGVGKTFFLNYLLSKFTKTLDAEKVIWVRINLINNVGFDSSLPNWIYAQIAKIVFRFYDVSSEYHTKPKAECHDYYRHLDEWLKKTYGAESPEYARHKDSLDLMRDVFSKPRKDRAIDPVLCSPVICLELFTFCRELGYSFIVVLDGFDRLDTERTFVKRFGVIRGQVSRLLGDHSRFGAALLITMRDATATYVASTNPFHRLPNDVRYCIESPAFQKIIHTRIDAILDELDRSTQNGTSYSEKDWSVFLRGFLKWFEDNATEFGLSYVEEKENENNREKMQIVQMYFQQYVAKETNFGYRLIEHMAKAGLHFPPVIYEYRQVGAELSLHTVGKAPYDARMLPIITRPPLVRQADRQFHRKSYEGTSVLHGVRIVQLLRAQQRLVDRERDSDFYLTVEKFADLLNKALRYDPRKSEAYLDELENYDVLRTVSDLPADMSSNLRKVVGLRKATFIFEKCLTEVAYLNLCAMRTVVGPDLTNTHHVFRAARIDGLETKDLQRWVNVKVCNAIAMTKLLISRNEKERLRTPADLDERLDVRQKAVWSDAVRNGLFDFSGISASVSMGILAIWKTLGSRRDAGASADVLAEEFARFVNVLAREWPPNT